jgi:hypothetical protein
MHAGKLHSIASAKVFYRCESILLTRWHDPIDLYQDFPERRKATLQRRPRWDRGLLEQAWERLHLRPTAAREGRHDPATPP